MKKFISFAIAGGAGFLVDTGVLYLAIAHTPLGPYFGRALAIAAAMSCTWYINRRFTFHASGRPLRSEGARYGSVGLGSALLNYAVYSLIILIAPRVSPYVALILGSASATVFSYMGYSRFVFGKPPTESELP
jgi:putative flippase GtrA